MRNPARLLLSLAGGSLLLMVVFLGLASAGGGMPVRFSIGPYFAVSDTDSVAISLPDSLRSGEVADSTSAVLDSALTDSTLNILDLFGPDSLVAASDSLVSDSTATVPDTTRLVQLYFKGANIPGRMSSLLPRRRQPLMPNLGNYWRHEVKLDSTKKEYNIRETVAGKPIRYPVRIGLDEYVQARLDALEENNFRTLNVQRTTQRRLQAGRGGLAFSVSIPGGQNSAISTLFGTPEVSLRVNGRADIDAGFSRQITEDAGINNRPRTDPTFGQNIRLGITGTIGDKLRIDVNWDTQRQFEFENQIKLEYTGYEDEIIQKIVAGNVTLQTPSSLINGGRSLFGVRSDLKLGGVSLTVVASQQKGNGNELVLEGGSEKNEFTIRPFEYEDNTHFFTAYYFRSNWETALADPNLINIGNLERITDIEVWKLNIQQNPDQEDLRNAIALADLGERRAVLSNPYTNITELPSPTGDAYEDATLTDLRLGTNNPQDVLGDIGTNTYTEGRFQLLQRGRDYEIDEILGYITLTSKLTPNEALAVAYRYIDRRTGQAVQIGDLTGSGGSSTGGGVNDDRLVLKMIRRPNQIVTDVSWPLALRNIYRLGARNINPNEFELDIFYDQAGSRQDFKPPEITFPGNARLLQVLGLDRVDENGYSQPDNLFDLDSYVFDPATGRIVFPYLEPFGERIKSRILDPGTIVRGITKEEAIDRYVFDTLYVAQPSVVRSLSQFDIYKIAGSNKSTVQSTYNLGFAIVEGSVQVRVNGNEISAADYLVNYDIGTIEITNPSFLAPGNEIKISYERQQFTSIQQKNLFGLRADYTLRDRLQIGGTLMRLREKAIADKFRLGQEPISNLIWGVDGSYTVQSDAITRLVDALPLIQTKAPSSINLKGEFAQLRPGTSQTLAFNSARRDLRAQGRDFDDDEQAGISYVDDFEGLKTTYSLAQAGLWRLSSAPDSLVAVPPNSFLQKPDSVRGTWRGRLGWFQVGRQIYNNRDFDRQPIGPASVILATDVFPNLDITGRTIRDLETSTFNMIFDPGDRGPYNYTTELDRFVDPAKREQVWGGMSQRLPEGYTDFNSQNIEFIEFIVQPYTQDSGPDAKLFVNLGTISEDIIPNFKFNTEDGLSVKDPLDVQIGRDFDRWGRFSTSFTDNVVQVQNDADRRTEDLGLDGLSSYDGNPGANPFEIYRDAQGTIYTEQRFFKDYLDAINPANSSSPFKNTPEYQALYQRALLDPSGDDFHDFRDQSFFNSTTFPGYSESNWYQNQFNYHFGSHELNSFEAQREIRNEPFGNSKIPDTEDINANNTVDLENNYYEYEIPLDPLRLEQLAHPDSTNDYIVSKTSSEVGDGNLGWYLVRIPVREFSRKVGSINGFSLVQFIRLWTSGHRAPATLRFASFDLVGSQWRTASDIGSDQAINTNLSITTINTEEDANTYVQPVSAVVRKIRDAQTGVPRDAREQSMQLVFDKLLPGDQRAVFKTFNQGLDFLKYENVRMFSHLHGFDESKFPLDPETHNPEDVRLFVRFGSSSVRDFYEYELPLVPSDPFSNNADEVWQTFQSDINGNRIDRNSLLIIINHLKSLKTLRDDSLSVNPLLLDSTFWHVGSGLDQLYTEGSLDYLNLIGARLGIRGNPSLSRITNVTLGLRNTSAELVEDDRPLPLNEGKAFDQLTLWVNELRVSGYDRETGNAGLGTASVRLADLATISANYRQETDGFGSLDSQLGTRKNSNSTNWGLSTSFNLHKLLPEATGWNIPVAWSIKTSTSIPRFSPDQGDVRIADQLAQIDENTNLDAAQKQEQKDEIISSAQTENSSRSISVPISKRNSKTNVGEYLLDPLSVTYNRSSNEVTSPTTRFDESWRWSSALNYRLNGVRPKTLKPFWFIPEDVPVIRALGRLQFNYLPQSIQASATADRNFKSSRQRPRTDQLVLSDDPTAAELLNEADEIRYPFRQNHSFGHRRSFSFQYNPFDFIGLSYNVDTQQTLLSGIDSLFTVKRVCIPGDSSCDPQSVLFEGSNRFAADEVLLQDTLNYAFSRVQPVATRDIVQQLFTSSADIRSDQHNQNLSATLDPQLQRIKSLSWLQVRPITYTAGYSWSNGNRIGQEEVGASVGSRTSVRANVIIQWEDLLSKIPLIERVKRRETEYQRARAQKTPAPPPPPVPKPPVEEEVSEEDDPAKPVQQEKPPRQRRRFSINIPSPLSVGRQLLMTIAGIRDLNVNYNTSKDVSSSNVSGGYSMFDPTAPPLSYRFGFNQEISPEQRINNEALQISDQIRRSQQFTTRGSWNVNSNVRLNFDFDADVSDNEKLTFRPDPETGFLDAFPSNNGKVSSTAWAFGASYEQMARRQLERFMDLELVNDTLVAPTGQHAVLTNESVVTDFRKSFLFGNPGTIDKLNFLPAPRPNWNLTYSGLSRFALFKRLFASATLKHGYSSSYDVDYRSNAAGGQRNALNLAGSIIGYETPSVESNSVRINERYAPLAELSLRWKFGLQTDLRWNRANSYSFNSTNFDVTSNLTDEYEARASFSKQGIKLPFKLPFMKSRVLNNTIRFSLTFKYSSNEERIFSLRKTIEAAIPVIAGLPANADLNSVILDLAPSIERITNNLNFEPRLSYTFSNKVTADAFFTYRKRSSENKRDPDITTMNGGFNIRVNISN